MIVDSSAIVAIFFQEPDYESLTQNLAMRPRWELVHPHRLNMVSFPSD